MTRSTIKHYAAFGHSVTFRSFHHVINTTSIGASYNYVAKKACNEVVTNPGFSDYKI